MLPNNEQFGAQAQQQAGDYQGNLQTQINALDLKIENLIKNHLHDGNTAQRIRGATDILGAPGLIVGIGTMSSGALDIKDGRIKANSVGIGMMYNRSSNSATEYNVSGGYLSAGIYRFFEGSFSQSWQVAYIIVP